MKTLKHKWYPQNKNGWYYKQYGAKARRCMNCLQDNWMKGYTNPYSGMAVKGTGNNCPGTYNPYPKLRKS